MTERRTQRRRSSDLAMDRIIEEIRDTNRRVDSVLAQIGILTSQIMRHDQERTATLVETLTRDQYLASRKDS